MRRSNFCQRLSSQHRVNDMNWLNWVFLNDTASCFLARLHLHISFSNANFSKTNKIAFEKREENGILLEDVIMCEWTMSIYFHENGFFSFQEDPVVVQAQAQAQQAQAQAQADYELSIQQQLAAIAHQQQAAVAQAQIGPQATPQNSASAPIISSAMMVSTSQASGNPANQPQQQNGDASTSCKRIQTNISCLPPYKTWDFQQQQKFGDFCGLKTTYFATKNMKFSESNDIPSLRLNLRFRFFEFSSQRDPPTKNWLWHKNDIWDVLAIHEFFFFLKIGDFWFSRFVQFSIRVS